MARADTLLLNATATGPSIASSLPLSGLATFHASGTVSSGTGSATINIEVSNDATNWLVHDTITLALSTSAASAGIEMSGALWAFVRANVVALSGTGASVTVTMGA